MSYQGGQVYDPAASIPLAADKSHPSTYTRPCKRCGVLVLADTLRTMCPVCANTEMIHDTPTKERYDELLKAVAAFSNEQKAIIGELRREMKAIVSVLGKDQIVSRVSALEAKIAHLQDPSHLVHSCGTCSVVIEGADSVCPICNWADSDESMPSPAAENDPVCGIHVASPLRPLMDGYVCDKCSEEHKEQREEAEKLAEEVRRLHVVLSAELQSSAGMLERAERAETRVNSLDLGLSIAESCIASLTYQRDTALAESDEWHERAAKAETALAAATGLEADLKKARDSMGWAADVLIRPLGFGGSEVAARLRATLEELRVAAALAPQDQPLSAPAVARAPFTCSTCNRTQEEPFLCSLCADDLRASNAAADGGERAPEAPPACPRCKQWLEFEGENWICPTWDEDKRRSCFIVAPGAPLLLAAGQDGEKGGGE